MNNNKNVGCLWWIGNLVFAFGCLIMLSNTVDLMTLYAPESFLGYEGIQGWYGFAVGLLLEGTLILMKVGIGKPSNAVEWVWDIILMAIPLVISGLAQSIHGFVVTNTLNTQPEEIQLAVAWLVPNVPTLLVALWMVRGLLETMPPDVQKFLQIGGTSPNSRGGQS